MKILIYTPVFYPHIGGVETITKIIAEQLSENGNDVVVITPTPNTNKEIIQKYTIIRDTKFKTLWKYYKWCDIFIHSVLSLKAIWPILSFKNKKWIAIHHTCYFYPWDKRKNLNSMIKQYLTRFSNNIAVSEAVGKNLHLKHYTVIKNAYNNSIFKCNNTSTRRNFIYVGRLVTEKGVNLLIKAFYNYTQKSKERYSLTIVGDGPEKKHLLNIVHKYNLEDLIQFKGALCGESLVNELNKYKCIIIPSAYKEAFGIVALEGIACGCYCIASDGDGLQETIGDIGLLFQKGSIEDLTQKMLMIDTIQWNPKEKENTISKHLSQFTIEYVGNQYVKYINQLIK